MDAAYRWLGGSNWQVAFTLHADGTPVSLSEFTVYFPLGSFDTLSLQASPATWNSVVGQPDPGAVLESGFLDGLLPAPAPGLAAGQSQAGWVVNFSYLGAGQPGALHFDIVDPSDGVTVLSSGVTALVPEPSQHTLLVAGAVALGFLCSRRRTTGGAA
jgi:hypothetical protein